MITSNAKSGKSAYRILPTLGRRPAPNEPGTMRQLLAIQIYLDAQQEERRTGTAAARLWTVCQYLETDCPTSNELGE